MIQRKQLEGAHMLLASIVESMHDAIVSTTLDGIVLTWNAAAEKLYGYRPNDIKGRRINVLFYPDGMEEMNRILDEVRQGERVAQQTHIVPRARRPRARIRDGIPDPARRGRDRRRGAAYWQAANAGRGKTCARRGGTRRQPVSRVGRAHGTVRPTLGKNKLLKK